MKILLPARHQYDLEADELNREATDIICTEESLTVENHPDADINELVRRMGLDDGSILPGLDMSISDPSYYGDFSETPNDLRGILEMQQEAVDRFNALPANIRSRFNNDPAQLYRFIHNEQNWDEAVKLGLLAYSPLANLDTEAKPADIPPSPNTE